jgi:hypothetical protein
MREIVFRVVQEPGGILRARSLQPQLQIRAASLEDLHHEAREALIGHYGSAHSTVRVRLQRPVRHPVSLGPWAGLAVRP